MKLNNCSSLSKRIIYICDKEYSFFLNKNHVVGIGLGYKTQNGFLTYKECIKVFVDKKISLNDLSYTNMVPKLYKGIKTDVVESGFCSCSGLTKRVRPVLCGYSVSPPFKNLTGTIGCLVTDGFSTFLLGNNHVFANRNTLQLNTPILQPGLDDGGKTSQDVIALLSKFIPIKFNGILKKETNYVDSAIAKVLDKNKVKADIAFLGKPKGISSPSLDQTVAKCGRTTELTLGKVTAINATYTIGYGFKSALFKNQIITTGMAESGDSGSVLLDNKKYVLGLLAGTSAIITIYNNIHDVLNLLNVQIVTN